MQGTRARDDSLTRLQALVDEQAALRRVATLVAGDPEPRQVFECVCEEVAKVLTNAARHARPSSVGVRLRCGDGRLRIEVRDDGIGGADARSGMRLDSPAGAGTTLTGEIPLS
jgi:anti-sigma regulatory factor (Ser/Thr protein kinase)